LDSIVAYWTHAADFCNTIRRKADISDYDAVSARTSANVSTCTFGAGEGTKKSF
jgi:hypothetical protein